jgi:CTP:molybdopterin cytidylyltransferase MocA
MTFMSQGDVVAVVLGGGGPSDRLARAVGAPSKALVPLEGAPLGAYVLASLRASGVVRAIVYVGPTDERLAGMVDVCIPAGERLVDSLALGLGAGLALGGSARLLVVTADVPWWSAAGVRAFVEGAPAADLVYPVVRAEDALAAFPEQRRTFVTLVDGRVTGGNATLLRPGAVATLLPWIDRAYRARKRPLQLAGMVGWGTLARLVTGRATLALLETRISALLGLEGRVYVSKDPAIAADVDAPEHLHTSARLPPLVVGGGAA